MPIVDDPHTFGKIAAANAISDVYAMGGTPLMAIAILGWPVNSLPARVAGEVLEGGRQICIEAGIPLAGGHSIDSPEPIFGMAVTGRVRTRFLKKNSGAKAGDKLYLSKPIGVGILSTAQKQKKLTPEHGHLAAQQMTRLNSLGQHLGACEYVHAITDVTGFGLFGHLGEMCRASSTYARVEAAKVPLIDAAVLDYYLDLGCVPGGTSRNLDSYGKDVRTGTPKHELLFADPQTSGGLLCAVDPDRTADFETLCATHGYALEPFGEMRHNSDVLIDVI